MSEYKVKIRSVEPSIDGSVKLDVFVEKVEMISVTDEGGKVSQQEQISLVDGGHRTLVLSGTDIESIIGDSEKTAVQKKKSVKDLILAELKIEKLVSSDFAAENIRKTFVEGESISVITK